MAAFSAFIATYPNSHLAGDAEKAKARLLARDMPPRQPKSPDQPPDKLAGASHSKRWPFIIGAASVGLLIPILLGVSIGSILIIILVIFLLGGLSGRFGGYGYGYGHGGVGIIGTILIIVVVLILLGRI